MTEKEEETKKELEKFWNDKTNELEKDEKIKMLTTQKHDLEGIIRLLKEEGGCATISDDIGNKKMVKGTIGGFSVRTAVTRKKLGVSIADLDQSWQNGKILCIFLEDIGVI